MTESERCQRTKSSFRRYCVAGKALPNHSRPPLFWQMLVGRRSALTPQHCVDAKLDTGSAKKGDWDCRQLAAKGTAHSSWAIVETNRASEGHDRPCMHRLCLSPAQTLYKGGKETEQGNIIFSGTESLDREYAADMFPLSEPTSPVSIFWAESTPLNFCKGRKYSAARIGDDDFRGGFPLVILPHELISAYWYLMDGIICRCI